MLIPALLTFHLDPPLQIGFDPRFEALKAAPPFDARAKVEAVVSTSAFAHFRPKSEREWQSTMRESRWLDESHNAFLIELPLATLGYAIPSGRLYSIRAHSLILERTIVKPIPNAELDAAGRRAAEQLDPSNERPRIEGSLRGDTYSVVARRTSHGLVVDDGIRIDLDPNTGRADGAYLEPPIDAETLGGARTLALESLRGFAWRYVTLMGAQAEITLDEVRIAVSPETERHPRGYPVDESYMALARAGRGIPMFRLEIEDEYRRVFGIYLDARNGATVFGYVWEPLGGTPHGAVAVPRRLTVAGRKEGGEVNPTTVVGKAEGAPVLLVRGRTVFRAVFDAATNVVWIGREGHERAYRPNADLRKALVAQSERRKALMDRP